MFMCKIIAAYFVAAAHREALAHNRQSYTVFPMVCGFRVVRV